MEKFMYLFRGGINATSSPETMQAQMQKWQQWMQTLAESGNLVGGDPLQGTGKQVAGAKKVISDGPYTEAKEIVGGYLVINANNIDHAVDISQGCPIFDVNGSVEIRPIQQM